MVVKVAAGGLEHVKVVRAGNIAQSLRRLTRELCDGFVRIPSTGVIDSFNLGTASGIILTRIYDARRAATASVPKK